MSKFIKKLNDIWDDKCKNYSRLPSTLPKQDRIIVIGDIHGDLKQLVKCLKIAKVINNDLNWIGGDTIVVQVGDQIDSCRSKNRSCDIPGVVENDMAEDVIILKYLSKLHKMAEKQNGAVYSLIGNHEMLNVYGNMSYVSYENINEFKDYKTKNGSVIHDPMEGRKYAFSPGNELANFLGCTRQFALIIGSNLFVHAGMTKEIMDKYNIEDLNSILSLYLFDELNNRETFHDLFMSGTVSPLWNRVFGSLKNSYDDCKKLMKPLETVYKVGKIYVGHTPQVNKGITSVCDNTVWKVDVGVSKAFNSFDSSKRKKTREAQVLEILNDGETFNVLK